MVYWFLFYVFFLVTSCKTAGITEIRAKIVTITFRKQDEQSHSFCYIKSI